MADKREKTLSYRRAEWLEEPPGNLTLEQLLKSAHRKLKSVAERTILRDTGQCIRSVKKKEPQTGGIFVHLTVDTPGEAASVIPKIKVGQEEIDVGTAAPPPDSEFMDGDAFLFVVDNHVCLCSSGVRDGAIRLFLYEFFKKADLGDAATMFDLMKVANVSKLKMLHAQGVKEIELKATLYQATMKYEKRKNQASGLLGAISKHVSSLMTAPTDIEDGLRVMLTIKTDERFSKGVAIGEKKIEKLAADVVKNQEDYDDYRIITGTGQTISPTEIFVNNSVLIDSLGKSVKRDKAWDELSGFYKTLNKTGVLEQ